MKPCDDCQKMLGRQSKGKNVRRCWDCYRVWIKSNGHLLIRQNSGVKGPRPQTRGENHWNWKGGKYSDDYRERRKFRREMQMLIFKRDNYTCQICFAYGSNIQVDHIKSWADYPELRFVPNNCRTLCMACHYYVTFKRKLPQGVIWGHNLNQRISKLH